VQWNIGRLPKVQGDGTLLRAAFINLFSNAIKFTSRREVAVIEVGRFRETRARWSFMSRTTARVSTCSTPKKLFGVFQRMHRQGEFEGTGVGLATVQRIITATVAGSGPKRSPPEGPPSMSR